MDFDIDIVFSYRFEKGELKALKANSKTITGLFNLLTKKGYIILKGYKRVVGFKENDIINHFVVDATHESLHYVISEVLGFHQVKKGEEMIIDKIVNYMEEKGEI